MSCQFGRISLFCLLSIDKLAASFARLYRENLIFVTCTTIFTEPCFILRRVYLSMGVLSFGLKTLFRGHLFTNWNRLIAPPPSSSSPLRVKSTVIMNAAGDTKSLPRIMLVLLLLKS
ncbi:hypothetical protein F5050DRAFT_824178 [Lentinula boryana]|uniref:Uncharacterized protein n=1 Tax=Lentinula boryana TaxID=40481 RepID=A0ABQ8Q2Q3_9AGAR|nr:hypothetical protein F5050DRAFT_824178 [Lentinula boryana]